jgi:hypothetical protein
VIPPASSRAALVALVAAAELRSIAAAVDALADVSWQSPAGAAFRALVAGIAAEAGALAGNLEAAERG